MSAYKSRHWPSFAVVVVVAEHQKHVLEMRTTIRHKSDAAGHIAKAYVAQYR
jgi:hypothetical protein